MEKDNTKRSGSQREQADVHRASHECWLLSHSAYASAAPDVNIWGHITHIHYYASLKSYSLSPDILICKMEIIPTSTELVGARDNNVELGHTVGANRYGR